MKILIIGYGNPGRLDDGLGPALAERFQCLETDSVGAQNIFQGLDEEQTLQNPPRPAATPPVEGILQGSKNVDATSPSRFFACAERDGDGASTVGAATVVPPALTVESDYQLNVEDAAQIAEHDIVIFADASTDAEPPFAFTPVVPEAGGLSFSSHSVSAPQLMGMVKELFHAEPQAYMLAIRGVEFNEFGERLSEQAEENLKAAAEFLKKWLLMTNDERPNDGRNDEARNT